MNPHDIQFYDIFDDDPGIEYHQDYREGIQTPLTRIRLILLVALCFLPIVYQIFISLDFNLLPLPNLLWNVFVYLTPSQLLDVIENYINPLRISNPALIRTPRTHAAKCETMRRILNFESQGGLIGSVAQAGRKRLLSNNTVTQEPDGRPAGLGNWDNSCYQNSVLQGLASLNSLSEYLNRPSIGTISSGRDENDKSVNKMAEALRGLIESLNDPLNNGRSIWTPASLKNMSSWQQQDAQEYFSKVLDEIDREMGTTVKSTHDFAGFLSESKVTDNFKFKTLRNPLEGLIAQRVGCLKCGFSEGLSLIPFNCLTVPLGRCKDYDISECLDEYTKLELIEGVECGKCTLIASRHLLSSMIERIKDSNQNSNICLTTQERFAAITKAIEDDDYEDKTLLNKCKINSKNRITSTKSRQAVIARPPRSLVIHFNRSLYDEVSGDLRKNCCHVKFPKVLDLGPWCLGSAGEVGNLSTEEWIMNPDWPMVASSTRLSRQKGPTYELRAVVTHYGRHENGHYVCYKKHPVVGTGDQQVRWWRLSDDEVMRVSEENVLGQGGVFMLFYDCIEPASPIFPEEQINNVFENSESLKSNTKKSKSYTMSGPDSDYGGHEFNNLEDSLLAANVPLPHAIESELSENDQAYSVALRLSPKASIVSSSITEPENIGINQEGQQLEHNNSGETNTTPQYHIWEADEVDDNRTGSRKGSILSASSPLLMV